VTAILETLWDALEALRATKTPETTKDTLIDVSEEIVSPADAETA
jgi:hypothetical protein